MATKKTEKKEGLDAIVVGAGIVGSYVARRIAEQGRSVLLIDNRRISTLGAWKNSGHNIDKEVFERLPIRRPTGEELGAEVDTAHYDSPKTCFDFRLPMYNVRLGEFTRRMVSDAVAAGVEFRDETECVGAIVENGAVVGIEAQEVESKRRHAFRAPLTIDVSGIGAAVRDSLPDEMGIEKGLDPKDVMNVYSEDREVGMKNWPVPFVYHGRFQGWCGSRRPGVVGIGLGRFVSTGEDPREIHPEFAKYALPIGGKTIYRTYQRVPVRNPLHKLVANGVMILGDAAYQGKPLNGEGLSVMLDAAEMAADVAGRAYYRHDLSEKSLWPYSRRWHRNFGARFAPLHRMRKQILALSKDDQNFLLGLGLYGPKEMSSVMLEGKIAIGPDTIARLFGVAARGASRPKVLSCLLKASIDGMKLRKLYARYPDDPAELAEWIKAVKAVDSPV